MRDRAPRQHELDWLRLLAVVLVVALHLAETYTRGASDPIARWAVQSSMLGRVVAMTNYVRMPVLFCVAGMVAVHTRGQRTLGTYLRSRAERLLQPLLVGLLVLTPVQRVFDAQFTDGIGSLFVWGYFWFLGALAAITIITLPIGVWLARSAVQARLAHLASKGGTLALVAALPLVAALVPFRWLGVAPVLGHVDLKTLIGYGANFVVGMVLASAPAFRTRVMDRRGTVLRVWAIAAAIGIVGPRFGVDGHVLVIVGGVTGSTWVLACYGFAARYLAAPSEFLTQWGPRALAIYALHGVALAAAKCIALPLALPVAAQVTLLVALTVGGALTLVRLAESYRMTAEVLGLRYAPARNPVRIDVRIHAPRTLVLG